MKTNEKLQQDVEDALKWEPLLHAAEIGVIAKDGIVTLTGTVDSYRKIQQAENAAKNVSGVKAVVEKIEIILPQHAVKTDEEIAEMSLRALKDNWSVPDYKIKLKVERGWIYLEGDLEWEYQRKAALNAVRDLTGVKGVINNIKIKSEIHDKLEEKMVADALKRHWALGNDKINVKVSGTNVTLTGTVESVYEKEQAGRIAWKTPGVWSVDNKLVVEYDYSLVD